MAIYDELRGALGGPNDANMDDIAQSRLIGRELSERAALTREPVAGLVVEDFAIEGPGGHLIPARVFRRSNLPPARGVVLFIHGGAFVFGDLDSENDRCAVYATRANVVVVALDYRLAPEHLYPAGLDDCEAMFRWLCAHAGQWGADPSKIVVAGASAGGALAAGTVARIHDEGVIPITAQMLLYPVLDDRLAARSITDFEFYEPWDGDRSRKMWHLYLGGSMAASADAAPARRENLSGLPPAYVMACEEDPLRDEDLDYARRLVEAGVSVELHLYRNTYHAFDVIAPEAAISKAALVEQADFLQRVIGS